MGNTQPYDRDYYSDKHIAYADGYTLQTRRIKYADVVDNICKYLGEPLLDVGCGPGYLVCLLREKGFKAYGCDFSDVAMELVPKAGKAYVKWGDIRQLPYRSLQFSSSTAFHVLEHIEENEVGKGLEELFRVTKTRFYGFIPTSDGIVERDMIIRDRVLHDPTHVTIKKRKWWLDKFEAAGWKENVQLEEKFDKKGYGWVFVMDK